MKLLEKILLPIDFSESTDLQVDNIIPIAKIYESEVIILALLPEDAKIKSVFNLIKESVTTKINQINQKLNAENIKTSEPSIVYGEPVENVLKTARVHNVNVIILPSHLCNHNKEKLGVYTEKIIRRAEKPVWVIKKGKKIDNLNILCPIDFSSASERALNNAIILTRIFKAKLSIISVFTPIRSLSIWIEADLEDENKKSKDEYIGRVNEFISKQKLNDLNYSLDIIDGDPVEEILNYTEKNGIDLLIMGTTGRNSIGKALIGSVTQEVVRHVNCSFITTKSIDIINLKLDNEIKSIETHVEIAKKMEESGLYEEAITQYETCLKINSMHIPAHYSIAKLYKKINKIDKANYYEKLASDLMDRIWDRKIEDEIKKFYTK
ncbi:universal stress protein [Saccharicrinis sp. 156]|uniref:universal stress protein n=1 Tax=Saccharicrinis sp. 156 TaxID=3417574 RepID=UPI003D35257D